MDIDLLNLLKAYVHSLEATKRRVALIQQLVEAHQRGEPIAPPVLDEYARQTEAVAADRERLQTTLTTLSQGVGEGTVH